MSAVKNGNRDVFTKLLDYPQDISIVCKKHMNVLHYIACYQDDTWWYDELKNKRIHTTTNMKELLNARAKNGRTTLHYAALSHLLISWLLENGADMDIKDENRVLPCQLGDTNTQKIFQELRYVRTTYFFPTCFLFLLFLAIM